MVITDLDPRVEQKVLPDLRIGETSRRAQVHFLHERCALGVFSRGGYRG
jgi:hypothetical protein